MKLIKFLSLALVAISLVSCTEKVIPPVIPPSSDNDLKSFTFEKGLNSSSGLLVSPLTTTIGKNINVTVNIGTDITYLIPTVKSGKNAKFYINNELIESGVTGVNFSKTATLTIEAENGETNEYSILVKDGNPTIDAAIYKLMKDYSIPGVSISATKNEKIVYSYGYGFANTSSRERVTPKHLFRLASMSKSQTSLCIMNLMEQGKLQITDRVFGEGGIFEEEFGTNLVEYADQVTIQHLLEHTSGWSNDPIFGYTEQYYGKSVHDRMDYLVHNDAPSSPPGTTFFYYNMGYAILGAIIEKISGIDYETYIRENIYKKAGVTDIWVGGDLSKKRNNEVIYYSQDGRNGYGNEMEVIKALGGLIACTEDLMQVMSSIDYGTVVPDILKPETLDVMYTPSVVSPHRYALGWRLNHTIFTSWENYHGGNLAGTGTLWCRDKKGTAAVILCNSRSYKSDFDVALFEILSLIQNNI